MAKNVILVLGRANQGKSSSLRTLPLEEVAYLNADLTNIPFPNKKINEIKISEPLKVPQYIAKCEEKEGINYIVLDTITVLLRMFERKYVAPKAGTKEGMSAWAHYSDYYGNVVHALKAGKKHTIVLGHDAQDYDEGTMEVRSKLDLKGSAGKTSERDFSIILTARLVNVDTLKQFDNPWLNITEDEEFTGQKYVFQTKPFQKEGNMSRTPLGMFDRNSIFIDNDMAQFTKLLDEYYGSEEEEDEA